MNNKGLLPMGSVVLLKNATHRLMIIGFAAIRYGTPNKVYDYWGSPYPEGQFESDQHMIFNHKDIVKVFAEGYSDDSEKKFRAKIEKVLTEVRDENYVLTASSDYLAKLAGKDNNYE